MKTVAYTNGALTVLALFGLALTMVDSLIPSQTYTGANIGVGFLFVMSIALLLACISIWIGFFAQQKSERQHTSNTTSPLMIAFYVLLTVAAVALIAGGITLLTANPTGNEGVLGVAVLAIPIAIELALVAGILRFSLKGIRH